MNIPLKSIKPPFFHGKIMKKSMETTMKKSPFVFPHGVPHPPGADSTPVP